MNDDIAAEIQQFKSKNSRRLFTEEEFERELLGIQEYLRLHGLSLELEIKTQKDELLARYGIETAQPAVSYSDDLGPFRYKLAASYFRQIVGFDQNHAKALFESIRSEIVEAANQFWGSRDGPTVLHRQTQGSNRDRLNESLREVITAGRNLSTLHLDLDFFKNINTEFGEPGGDQVLAEFGRRIRKHFGRSGLLIRKGGEEFSVFLPDMSSQAVLEAADRFCEVMRSENFPLIGRPNTCSIGVSFYPEHYANQELEQDNWFDYLLKPAMKAEERAKRLGRDCISLPDSSEASTPTINWGLDLPAAAVSTRSGWFANADLSQNAIGTAIGSALAANLQSTSIEGITNAAAKVQKRFAICTSEEQPVRFADTQRNSCDLHPLVWFSIVARAVLQASFEGTGPLNAQHSMCLRIRRPAVESSALLELVIRGESETTILSARLRDDEATEQIAAIGHPWLDIMNSAAGIKRVKQSRMSPVLLVVIGSAAVPQFARIASSAVIEIDDRPVTGGGLPDFWQSNVSRAVPVIAGNSNILFIVVVGDSSKAKQTLQVLRTASDWDLASMARRLSIDVALIQAMKVRKLQLLECGGGERDLILAFHNAYLSAESAVASAGSLRPAPKSIQSRLKITVQHDSLSILEGLRCRSAAEAYPKAVSLFRSEVKNRNRDYLRREYVELNGFKFVIEDPLSDRIPDYWLEDEAELQSYYAREFGVQGLFGSRFNSWGTTRRNQVEDASKEAYEAIKSDIASRRIMMFVADSTDAVGSPLGLVALQLVPRKIDKKWLLSFQWIWRTVEVLVGLPFSMFGSIEFSKGMVDRVAAKFGEPGQMSIGMGELTYIALSLHMFMGEGDEHIARAIVTSAI